MCVGGGRGKEEGGVSSYDKEFTFVNSVTA